MKVRWRVGKQRAGAGIRSLAEPTLRPFLGT